ncbi:unnamed protein product, partial [Clonostachys rhizophaga]
GAGKTTLLQHILKSDHGLRIAVIVNDMAGGITEQEQVAETFDARLTEYLEDTSEGIDQIPLETLKEIKELGGLEQIARIDTTVTVVDAFSVLGEFQTDELVSDRQHVEKKDQWTISDLMADQIEFADVDDHTKGHIFKIDPKQILNTGLFNLEVGQTGYGWLQDLHAMTVQEEDSEMVDALHTKFPIPSNETIMVNKRNHPILSPLFRSKGGIDTPLTSGRPWFCTLTPEEYTTGDKSVDRLVQHDIKKGGEWGDRRQELVFIGENINHKGLRGLLDDCLPTDEEYDTWQEIMRDTAKDDESKYEALGNAFEDGFPEWPGDDDDGEHDHDHGHPH